MDKIKIDYDIYDTIKKNIKKYRKEKGLTSAELAEMIDLSHEFVRAIQSTKSKSNFSVDTLYRISIALDVSLDKLVQK